MKGGKDEEKITGPLFPRLHVNDTEKGGPRAPPRNKMALYEQLSIPSQRFNSGLIPPTSSRQGGDSKRSMFSSFYVPPASTLSAEKLHSQSSDGVKMNTMMAEFEQKSTKIASYQTSSCRRHYSSIAECSSFHPHDFSKSRNSFGKSLGNEDDFRVPTFVHTGTTSCYNEDQQKIGKVKFIPLSPTHQCSSTVNAGNSALKAAGAICTSTLQLQNSCDKQLKQTGTADLKLRQHMRNQSEQKIKVSLVGGDSSKKPASHPSPREKTAEAFKDGDESSNNEHGNSPLNAFGKSCNSDVRSHQNYKAGLLPQNTADTNGVPVEPMRTSKNAFSVRNKSCFTASLGDEHRSPNGDENGSVHCEGKGNELFQVGDVDRNDDTSETSMVDSISGLDICPDDVVGVIGQKQFWKARKAIANQQRVFAVQVFELHRVIKVQRLIAASPNLLLEDHPCFGKPSLKASPVKKLQSEHVLKKPPQICKQKDNSQWQPNQNTECATVNTIGQPPLPYLSNGINKGLISQHLSYSPGIQPPAAPFATDNKACSWYFPPPGNQWLVPLISPSEGLVYKPYTGPCPPTGGFVGPIYGGCGPLSLPSMAGHFLNSAYGGVPAPRHQGLGVLPDAPPVGQAYFSPYGMPVMNPNISGTTLERMRPYAGTQPPSQADQISTGEVNINMHCQSSCNISSQKSGAISCAGKLQPSKDCDIQGGTASSHCERAQGSGTGNVTEGRDALPLFPMASAMQVSDRSPPTRGSDQQKRAIKVVPHNPRSATESVARIFRSIQEERKQNDTVSQFLGHHR